MMVIAGIYGTSSGAYIGLLPSAASTLVPIAQIGSYIGLGGFAVSGHALICSLRDIDVLDVILSPQ